ncbi:DNA-binding protein [Micromonospora sp. WMMD1102]|uniref:DNA-binding protein n=1 Tax=Micromonospora sp. WMMD1102 TaxID=3016105 RepID=UPI002414E7D9|nr:DNA-binding protein [Micromonospora sp. WMMD1102]MDG4788100.1 DNA-binding protein [Micromonospora sp. WMMD1102]
MSTKLRPAKGPTLDEIRAWPATVSVELAAAALGVGRSHAYESIRLGTFPARTLKVGRRTTVVTSSILAALNATPE